MRGACHRRGAEQVSGAQKQRSGLILSGRSATFLVVETVWQHPAPSQLPRQEPCRAEAPHRGAQAYLSAECTGRPEIAAQRRGFISPRLKMFNDRLRLTAALGGVTRPASLSATPGSNPGLVDYRASASSEWPGKLLPADGAGVTSPHPPGQAGTFPRPRGCTRSRGAGSDQ
jgi:hypothetical protein